MIEHAFYYRALTKYNTLILTTAVSDSIINLYIELVSLISLGDPVE